MFLRLMMFIFGAFPYVTQFFTKKNPPTKEDLIKTLFNRIEHCFSDIKAYDKFSSLFKDNKYTTLSECVDSFVELKDIADEAYRDRFHIEQNSQTSNLEFFVNGKLVRVFESKHFTAEEKNVNNLFGQRINDIEKYREKINFSKQLTNKVQELINSIPIDGCDPFEQLSNDLPRQKYSFVGFKVPEEYRKFGKEEVFETLNIVYDSIKDKDKKQAIALNVVASQTFSAPLIKVLEKYKSPFYYYMLFSPSNKVQVCREKSGSITVTTTLSSKTADQLEFILREQDSEYDKLAYEEVEFEAKISIDKDGNVEFVSHKFTANETQLRSHSLSTQLAILRQLR